MPNATLTEFGNVAVKARVDSRSTRSTYIVDDSSNSRGQTITRAEYDRVAVIQDAHIAKSRMVVVDGYIGSDIAVDHDHAGLRDMRVLDDRDAIIFGPGNSLPAGVAGVVDDVGGPGATRVDAGLNRDVSELR